MHRDVEAHHHRSREQSLLLLVVSLAGHRLALRAEAVGQIHQHVSVSPLPGAPDIVEGMVDVHGTVMPVVDMARRLTGRAQAADPAHMLVTVRTTRRELALHVGHDVELVEVDPERIRSATPLDIPGATGVVVLPDGLALIHDIDTLLSVEDGAALDEALRAAAAQPALTR